MSETGATPSDTDLLQLAGKVAVAKIHTQLPGKIVTYNAALQTATILPSVLGRRFDALLDTCVPFAFPAISNVPIAFPQGGGMSFTWPLVPGDEVILQFAERSISEWKAVGADVNQPVDPRRFDLTDAIAIPATTSILGATTQVDPVATVIAAPELRLGDVLATDFVTLETLVRAEIAALRLSLTAHVHSGVTTGVGSSGPPSPPIPVGVGPLAATKVKAI